MVELFEDLNWRGLVHSVTDQSLAQKLSSGSMSVYAGFDPTADSLHLGNLIHIITLRRFQLAGHRPIAVAGGGTGLIGDPGGKSQERNLLSKDQLEFNLASVARQLENLLDFSPGKNQAILLNNANWLSELNLLAFLRDVGKHFSVNQMIAKDSVRSRLEQREQGISYTEFSYMLLQAFDFLYLFDNYDCSIQIGGSDQWGNITTGIELIRRNRQKEAFGLTSPLLVKSDGSKFGKSEGENIWLDPKKTSPYKMFQFLLQTEDSLVIQLLRFFTFLSRDQILDLELALEKEPEKRQAQLALASQVTAFVHGEQEAQRAQKASEAIFSQDISFLDEKLLLEVLADVPSIDISWEMFEKGIEVSQAFALSKIVPSLSAARRLIAQGGCYLNNDRVIDPKAMLDTPNLIHGRYILLRRGRREQVLLIVQK